MYGILKNDKTIPLLLFILVSTVYFATITGITSSNDGSHYALVRALVERRSFEISPYLDFTEHQDYAMRGDLRFSDRPPGTALLAAPFYALSAIAPQPVVNPPSKHDPENPRLIYAVLPAALSASTAVVLFYLTLRRHFERSVFSALLASLGLAFGTTTWKYGSVLYSHAAAALVTWLTLYLLLHVEQAQRFKWPFLLGFIIGFAPLVEYTNVPFAIMIGAYLLIVLWKPYQASARDAEVRRDWLKAAGAFVLGGLIPAAFLLIYNTLNFGSPFEISTFNADTTLWPQNEGLAADFATPLLEGLWGMLFHSSNGNQGIFLLSPFTLLGLLGLSSLYGYSRRRFILVIGVFAAYLLIFAKSTTYNPLTNDGRYITTFIGLWMIPVAFWIDEHYLPAQNEIERLGLSLLVFGLLFLSVRNQLMHIAFSWNYDLDPAALQPLAASPENIRLLFQTVFPNARNLPLLWGGELLVFGVIGLVRRWRHRRQQMLISPSTD
jgi:hypothetical protein